MMKLMKIKSVFSRQHEQDNFVKKREATEIEDIFPHLPLWTQIRLITRGLIPHVHPSYILRIFMLLSGVIQLWAAKGAEPVPLAHWASLLLIFLVLEIYLSSSSLMNRYAKKFSVFDKASAALIPLAVASLPLFGLLQLSPIIGDRCIEVLACTGGTLLIWAACRGIASLLPGFIRKQLKSMRAKYENYQWGVRHRAEENKAHGSMLYRLRHLALQGISDPEEIQSLRERAIGSQTQTGIKGSGPSRL